MLGLPFGGRHDVMTAELSEPSDLSDAKTEAALDSAELAEMIDTNPELDSMPALLEEGRVIASRYRIIRHLGSGGMGNVYLAEHMAIGKKVAVKTLNLEFAKRRILRERFLREARSASQIRHANVVDITDFGKTDEGAPFIAMEYLEGEDLKQTLQREGRIPFERTRDIVVQICHALEAAHAKGIVHRDVKPANCFRVDQSGHLDRIKVVDFGIAKTTAGEADSTELTKTGVIVGTAAYMSPEQARGDADIDPRADVYSVGIILFRMLSGKLPYDSNSPLGMITKHLTDPVPSLLELDDPVEVSSTVDRIVMRALAKDKDERWQSAGALAEALSEAEHAHAAARSRKGVWIAAASLLGVALAAGGFTYANRVPPPVPAHAQAPEPGPAPAVEPEATTVLISIEGAPEGARLRIGGKDYGAASEPLRLNKDAESVTVEVAAEGYVSSSLVVVPTSDLSVSVSLVAAKEWVVETQVVELAPEPASEPKPKTGKKKRTPKVGTSGDDEKVDINKEIGF